MYRDYKGKIPETLLDGFSELPENAYIAVGSDTAYMFIGMVSDFFTELKALELYYSVKKPQGDKPKNRTFVPLLQRRVKDLFIRCDIGEPEIMTFIVEGLETGRVWLLSENEDALRDIHKFIERGKINEINRC